MIKSACLLAVCAGRIRCRGAGLVWVLNEVPEAVKHGLQYEPRAQPDLLKKDGHEHPGVDFIELELLSPKPGGDEVSYLGTSPRTHRR